MKQPTRTESATTVMVRMAGIIALVSALCLGIWFAYFNRNEVIHQVDDKLLFAAEFSHMLLGQNFHDGLVDEHSISDGQFHQILDRNDALCRRLGIQYLWSVLVLEDRIVFTSATRSRTDDPASAHAAFFETHRDPAAFSTALDVLDKPVFTTFANEWGRGRMILVPRIDAHGRRYIIGASMQMETLNGMISRALLQAGGIGLALFIVIGLLASVWVRRFTRLFADLIGMARSVMAKQPVILPPRSTITEVQQVCDTLIQMQKELTYRLDEVVRSHRREEQKGMILSRLARGVEITVLMEELTRFTEENDPGIRASAMQFDPSRNCLICLAAPRMPDDFMAPAYQGLPIGPLAGTCGTAAYLKDQVIDPDIQNSPRWAPHEAARQQAGQHHLHACWSEPILGPDGQLLGVISNYADHPGEPTPENLAVLCWAADVAALAMEQNRAERTLRKHRDLLDTTQQLGRIGGWEWDCVRHSMTWTDAVYHIHGMSPEEPPTTNADLITLSLNCYDTNDRPVIMAAFQRCVSDGVPYDLALPMTRVDGQRIHIRTIGKAVRENERIVSVIGNLIDITETLQAEKALAASDERFRFLLENVATVAVQGYATDGTVRYWNRASELFYGYSAAEAMGRNLVDLIIPPAQRQQVASAITDMVETGQVHPAAELTLMRKDGSAIPVYSSHAIVRTPGRDDELFCIDTDLTERYLVEAERERLQVQLVQSQKLESIGRLAGGVAHDFNNNLGVILGHAEMLLERLGPGNALGVELDEIRRSAMRSADLTRQLLAFARKQIIDPKVLDLNHTAQSLLKMLRRLIGEDIVLDWKPGDSLWAVKMDPAQVDQILANLCVNARDAISGEGHITISTGNIRLDQAACANHPDCAPGEYVCLSVQDDGCGMPDDVLRHIFEPFFTTKDIGKGTGLGLATVHGTVAQSHGFIQVSSAAGSGTCFYIYLPRSQETRELQTTETTAPPAVHGTGNILLVEDDPAVLFTTSKAMQGFGYTVINATSPTEALALAEQHAGKVDLLVTDVVMPVMNGKALSEKINRWQPGIKCLFMSGYTANVIAHHGVLDQGIHFIQKPFSRADLSRMLERILNA
jgi:PAS domain S-box-containing protein